MPGSVAKRCGTFLSMNIFLADDGVSEPQELRDLQSAYRLILNPTRTFFIR